MPTAVRGVTESLKGSHRTEGSDLGIKWAALGVSGEHAKIFQQLMGNFEDHYFDQLRLKIIITF